MADAAASPPAISAKMFFSAVSMDGDTERLLTMQF
jgi:hypothetical protein